MALVVAKKIRVAVSVAVLIAGCAGKSATSIPPSPASQTTSHPTTASTPLQSASADTAMPSPAEWTEVAPQVPFRGVEFADVTWTGTRFVAVGTNGSGRAVFLDSTDGTTWHLQPAMASHSQPESVAAGPGGIVVVGSEWRSSSELVFPRWTHVVVLSRRLRDARRCRRRCRGRRRRVARGWFPQRAVFEFVCAGSRPRLEVQQRQRLEPGVGHEGLSHGIHDRGGPWSQRVRCRG